MTMTTAYVEQAKLWQCFLEGATNRLRHQYVHGGTGDVTGIDAAKLACCFRATTARCRQLCHQVLYSRVTAAKDRRGFSVIL